jgi:nitroreductase
MDDLSPPRPNPASAEQSLHPLLRHRWSPRAMSGEPVPRESLLSVLEAARWAPSSFNEQPWRFFCAPREDAALFAAFFECMTPPNRLWVDRAGVLILGAVKERRDRDGEPNRYAEHDLGAGWACAAMQAVSWGLQLHVLGGFDRDAITAVCGLAEGFRAVSMGALGVPAEPDHLPEKLRMRELAPRSRHPLAEIAYLGRWDRPLV